MQDPQGILEMCPSLASRELNADDNKQGSKTSIVIEVVVLAHATMKEYLISLSSGSKFYSIADPVTAQGIITTVCLAYLSHINEKEAQKTRAQFPLAQFSSKYWLQYAKGSNEVLEVREATIRFLSDERTRNIWSSLYNPDFATTDITGPYKMATPMYAPVAKEDKELEESHWAEKLATMEANELQEEGLLVQQLIIDESKPKQKQDEDPNKGLRYRSRETPWERFEQFLLRRLKKNRLRDGIHSNALQAASAQGRTEAVALLLEAGAETNTCEGIYGNPLQASSAQGHAQIVKLLIDHGANPNKLGGFYGTALQAASARGHGQVVVVLLDNRADPRREGGAFDASLPAAAARGHTRIVELLLQHPSYLNPKQTMFQRALYTASAGAYIDIVKLLLNTGADMDVEEQWYIGALQITTKLRHFEIVKMLLDNGASINVPIIGNRKKHPLYVALMQGNADIVKLLIEAGANLNTGSETDNTPLCTAAKGGHAEIIRLLINHGAELGSSADDELSSPQLSAAVKNGHEEVVALLLELGATFDGSTLRAACHGKHETILRMLVRSPAMLTVMGDRERGWMLSNSLQLTARAGDENLLRILLEAGVQSNVVEGEVPQEMLLSTPHTIPMEEPLVPDPSPDDQGGDGSENANEEVEDLASVLERSQREILDEDCQWEKFGLVRGEDRQNDEISWPDAVMHSTLRLAALSGNELLIQPLLDAGASLMDLDIYEEFASPLDPTIKDGIIERLVGAGADHKLLGRAVRVAAQNGDETSLNRLVQWAATHGVKTSYSEALSEAARNGNQKLVKILLENGADPSADDYRIDNPFFVAFDCGHESVCLLLLDAKANVFSSYQNAFEKAARKDFRRLMPAMLSVDMDPAKRKESYISALRTAARCGNGCIMDIFFEMAEKSSVQLDYSAVLTFAARGGNEKAAKLLIEKGAQLNLEDWADRAELVQIIITGDEYLAELLLGSCSDFDEQKEANVLILHLVARKGFSRIVSMLLENGVSPASPSSHYQNVLEAAAAGGHSAMFDHLWGSSGLEDEHSGIALRSACRYGSPQMVERILRTGVDINSQDENYGTALYAASKRGHRLIAKMLIEAGADVNGQNATFGSALQVSAARGRICSKMAAAEGSHVHVIDLLLRHGADLNPEAGRWGGAIQAAASVGSLKTIKFLLARGADVNSMGGKYGSALHVAAYHDKSRTANLLLKEGASPDATWRQYGTPLHTAISKEHFQIAWTLVKRGANVNVQGGLYGNALQALAVVESNYSFADDLIERGADINGVGGKFGCALQAAAKFSPDFLKFLLKRGADPNIQGGEYGSPLQAACSSNRKKPIKRLIKAGAEVNSQGGRFESPLIAACMSGSSESVEVLLDHGADVNLYLQNGQLGSPLYAACFAQDKEVVELLLSRGADVNFQFGEHGNALQVSCMMRGLDIAEVLLANGASTNSKGGKFGSALQAASWAGYPEIVKMLLDHGAKVNLRGGLFGDALQAASSENIFPVGHGSPLAHFEAAMDAEEVEERPDGEGSTSHSPSLATDESSVYPHTAFLTLHEPEEIEYEYRPGHHAEAVRLLLDNGARIQSDYGHFGNALQAAVLSENKALVEKLMDAGADVNAKGRPLGTPLVAATACGLTPIVRRLLDAGADIDTQNTSYGTALISAASEGHSNVARLLLERGADIHARNQETEETALIVATKRGHGEIIKMLADAGADVHRPDEAKTTAH